MDTGRLEAVEQVYNVKIFDKKGREYTFAQRDFADDPKWAVKAWLPGQRTLYVLIDHLRDVPNAIAELLKHGRLVHIFVLGSLTEPSVIQGGQSTISTDALGHEAKNKTVKQFYGLGD